MAIVRQTTPEERAGAMQKAALRPHTVVAGLFLVAFGTSTAASQDATIRTLTDAYNASGNQLFAEFARSHGNIVLSPYSIGTAMAMTLAGARGETEREMVATLKHSFSREEVNAANTSVLSILNGYDKTSDPNFCPKQLRWNAWRCEGFASAERKCPISTKLDGDLCVATPTLSSAKILVANALMQTGHGDAISEQYKSLIKVKYDAEVYAGVGLDQVNNWVKRKTEGKIERMLDKLDPNSAVVLLNAIYFKAAWAAAFSKSLTRGDDFKISAAQNVQIPMMRVEASFPLIQRPGYRAIHLSYAPRALAMVVVLPNEVEGLGAITRHLDWAELAKLFSDLRAEAPKLVSLALPRFKIAFEAELVSPFRNAGIRLAFTDAADFSGMSATPPGVKISQIKHRAIIEVIEEGAEAAAATTVVLVPRALPPREPTKPIPFIVDHPSLFFIVDEVSGAILFQGQIVDPRPPSSG